MKGAGAALCMVKPDSSVYDGVKLPSGKVFPPAKLMHYPGVIVQPFGPADQVAKQ